MSKWDSQHWFILRAQSEEELHNFLMLIPQVTQSLKTHFLGYLSDHIVFGLAGFSFLLSSRFIPSILLEIQSVALLIIKLILSLEFKRVRVSFRIKIYSFFSSGPFTMIPAPGPTWPTSIVLEGKLGLTIVKPNYRPTGTHPSPRSVWGWRSASRSTSLSSTDRPTPCTRWLLMDTTAHHRRVKTRGSRWLVLTFHCEPTVTRGV